MTTTVTSTIDEGVRATVRLDDLMRLGDPRPVPPLYILDAGQSRDIRDGLQSWVDRDRIDGRHRNRHSRADRKRIARGLDPRRALPGDPSLAAAVRRLMRTS